jgi:hypothetical protein
MIVELKYLRNMTAIQLNMFDNETSNYVDWDRVSSGAANGNVQSSNSEVESNSLPTVTTGTSPEPETTQGTGFTREKYIADKEAILRKQKAEQAKKNGGVVPSEPSGQQIVYGISAEELLLKQVENIPCLIESLLQKTGLACIAGSSDTGKSSFLRYLCTCVVTGKSEFLGFEINSEHRRAIYVSTEDDETAVSYLLNKQNKDLHVESSQLRGLRFIFDTENLIKQLDDMMTVQPVDIVCIDAFTDLYGKSMDQSNQVRTFLNEYSQLAGKHKCLILFLHHCGKRTDDLVPSKHNLLGSQAFEAKMRLAMELKSDLHDSSLKHLCIVKGNYLPSEAKKESYQLRFTENMTFENTGVRVPFEELVKPIDGKNDRDKQKYELIRERQSQGFTQDEIAKEINYKDRSGVCAFIKRYEAKNKVDTPLTPSTLSTETVNSI